VRTISNQEWDSKQDMVWSQIHLLPLTVQVLTELTNTSESSELTTSWCKPELITLKLKGAFLKPSFFVYI